MIRTARGQSKRGRPAFGLTDPRKTSTNQLIQPGRSNICHHPASPQNLAPVCIEPMHTPWLKPLSTYTRRESSEVHGSRYG
jgi:hypothetical protein